MTATTTDQKTIVVCDDNDDILGFLGKLLSVEGYSVSTAHGYDELAKLVKGPKPDLIIMDINMPEHDGIWIAEELQSRGLQIPLIFITAFDNPIYRMNALVAGATEYLIKPFDADVLLKKVAKSFGARPTESNWDLQATESCDSYRI